MSNPEMMEALQALAAEKGISVESLLSALTDALESAYRRMPGADEDAWVTIDPSNFDIRVYAPIEIDGVPVDAKLDVTPKDFARVAAQAARQVMTQRLREEGPPQPKSPRSPLDVELTAVERRDLLNELARVYDNRDDAAAMLRRVGYPVSQLPPWDRYDPASSWRQVFADIDSGAIESAASRRLFGVALHFNRPNSVLRAMAIRHGIVREEGSDPEGDTEQEQLSTNSDPQFDVLLWHSRTDQGAVTGLAAQLRELGLLSWSAVQINPVEVPSGIVGALRNSRCLAVFVGSDPIVSPGPSHLDVQMAATETLNQAFRAFLVILPTAPAPLDPSTFPPFLSGRRWVDLRDIEPDKWANRLAAAITGERPPLPGEGTGAGSVGVAGTAVSPVVEEAIHFERIWSIVERAVDLERLSPEVEDEVRALNQMRHMALRLPVERYDDLSNMISSKLSALLPQVMDDLVPGVDPPIAPALRAAARDDAHDVQLEALDQALDATAGQLEDIAEEVTAAAAASGEDMEPYFRRPVERLVEKAQRIGATLRRIDDALDALSGTVVGRKIARLGYVGLRSAGGVAVAAGAASQTSIPIPGNVQVATVAVISAAVGNWLYSRRRRVDPSLPSASRAHDEDPAAP